MLKIQSHDPELGWYLQTRAGDSLPEAWRCLVAHRRRYPGTQHRLVNHLSATEIIHIPDDPEALELARQEMEP